MLIYDIEIKKAILGKNEDPVPGIEYCEGWADYKGMGISCICAYDYTLEQYRVFCEDNISGFQTLIEAHDFIIGFNNESFDNRVCAASDIIIPEAKSYDILKQIWLAAGLSPVYKKETHSGYNLDAVIKANLPNIAKTGNGANAPIDWQQGRIGTVIDYCMNDVWITKKIMDLVLMNGEIIDPKTQNIIQIQKPLIVDNN